MKVAFLVSNFPKNSETFVLNQITGLLDRGHEVNVFARYEPTEDRIHREVDEYNLKESTTYSKPPSNKLIRLLYAPIKAAQAPTSNIRLLLNSLKINEYGRDALSLQAFYMVLSFDLRDYDLIFCHFGPNGNIGALIRRSGIEVNLVTMFHGNDVRSAVNRYGNGYAPAFEESDMLLVNSKFNKKKLIGLGADSEKIRVHPIAIDTRKFQCPNNKRRRDYDKVIITTVGRLVEEKGHKFALEAIDEASQRTQYDIEYRLIGSGPLESDLRRQARRLGLEETVIFCGQRSRSGVIDELCQSDIFLLPSVDEGFGTVLLEAQSCQLPIVATRTGGIPEAVDNNSSFLVDSQNSKAIAEALISLIQNPAQRKSMGKAGRRFVVENYTIEAANDLLESRFKTILDNNVSNSTVQDRTPQNGTDG